ncbi:arabinofuranosidase catalytic domain-containing protein [Streptomyces canarius]
MYHTNTGSNKDPNNTGVHYPFVSAWLKNNGTSNFTLKYGNGAGGGLTTTFSGPLPNGYSPMKLDSSVLLGTGGDNSVSGSGEFFEGAMTAGYPSDATENAVQAAITAAGYGTGGGTKTGALRAVGAGRCLEVPGSSTTAGTQTQIRDCTSAVYVDLVPDRRTGAHRVLRQQPPVPGRLRSGHQSRHRRSSPGPATASPTSSGTSTRTAPSPVPSRACAWT